MPARRVDALIVAEVVERHVGNEVRQPPRREVLLRSRASRNRRFEAHDETLHESDVAEREREHGARRGRRRQDWILRLPHINGRREVAPADCAAAQNELACAQVLRNRVLLHLLRSHFKRAFAFSSPKASAYSAAACGDSIVSNASAANATPNTMSQFNGSRRRARLSGDNSKVLRFDFGSLTCATSAKGLRA